MRPMRESKRFIGPKGSPGFGGDRPGYSLVFPRGNEMFLQEANQ